MANVKALAHAMSALKTAIKNPVANPTEDQKTAALAHLQTVESVITECLVELDKVRRDTILAEDSTASGNKPEIRVSIMGSDEAFDVSNVSVTTDEGHVFVGCVYQMNDSGKGPVLLTPRYPVELTFDELRGLMEYVEKHKGQIPGQRSSALQ